MMCDADITLMTKRMHACIFWFSKLINFNFKYQQKLHFLRKLFGVLNNVFKCVEGP